MLEHLIKAKTQAWLSSDDCSVKDVINYIRQRGKLRDTQIEALETYLFLKIEGQNKPLWQLFSEGFFSAGLDLSQLNINEASRNFLAGRQDAQALYEFASWKENGRSRLPELEKLIVDEPDTLDYPAVIKSIFYNVNYADYLLSLPMGAGKTYLMAAFMYLDLYFARAEPANKAFAHNFLVLVPSGLKSSIVPSLKTIEHFDPSWVIAEPAASKLKQDLKFDILDEARSARRSNKAQNPNAQKVNQILPNPFGQVFVVNAEKVILDRLDLTAEQRILESDDDEKDRYANELRNLIGKIPNLSIMIDEVHHAATDDIKLRQVVNRWQVGGNIATVLGFSGTPYLAKPDEVKAGEHIIFKFSQITNTVYYYPLTTAIEQFLKKPTVKIGQNLSRAEIIRRGVDDFRERYGDKVYADGTIPKLAIYCSSIEVLEEEVFPFLTSELGISSDEILKYHKGNKSYALPKENEYEFRSLDLPISHKRYVLLVQIGKEGWSCRSLTGVILSQTGDSPKNMVLQTSSRCLRQVDPRDPDETALIWLNDGNAKLLNDQLKKEQKTTIDELNSLSKSGGITDVIRRPRTDYLKLPPVDFYQLLVRYETVTQSEDASTEDRLRDIQLGRYKTNALVRESTFTDLSAGETEIIRQTGQLPLTYSQWLFNLSKESFGLVSRSDLRPYDDLLKTMFKGFTFENGAARYVNELYDVYSLNRDIRLAFHASRRLTTQAEVVPQRASLLIVDKLKPVTPHPKLYPSPEESAKIVELDASGAPVERTLQEIEAAFKLAKEVLDAQGIGDMLDFEVFRAKQQHSRAVRQKERSFHYLPYDFKQSAFELTILKEALCLKDISERNLEVYFNGERGLTEFVIHCFKNEGGFWKNIGKYTTDFLILERRDDAIYKALILETKGSGYSNDPAFVGKKHYVETEFLAQNNAAFGYDRFDFLYLEDSDDLPTNLGKLSAKVRTLFND